MENLWKYLADVKFDFNLLIQDLGLCIQLNCFLYILSNN